MRAVVSLRWRIASKAAARGSDRMSWPCRSIRAIDPCASRDPAWWRGAMVRIDLGARGRCVVCVVGMVRVPLASRPRASAPTGDERSLRERSHCARRAGAPSVCRAVAPGAHAIADAHEPKRAPSAELVARGGWQAGCAGSSTATTPQQLALDAQRTATWPSTRSMPVAPMARRAMASAREASRR